MRKLRLDPITLIGIGVSLALALTLDVTGAATGVESLLAGLLGLVLSLQLETVTRAERRFELRRLVSAPKELGEALTAAAAAAHEIGERYPDTILSAEAVRRLERVSAGLTELGHGNLVREHGDYQDLLTQTRDCSKTLDALTNVAADPQWWTSEFGRAYWKLNERALARGVRIRRVFIVPRPNDPVLAVMRAQQAAGVEVHWARAEALPPSGHLNLIVWDGRSAWRARMSPHGQVAENVLVLDPQAVRELQGAFDRCLMHATLFEP